ncbi:MAG TPA: hypothetical protein VFQ28_06130 [Gaiella sp.]|nr:hypothetical protein [Gaiella sp.]
MPRSRAEREADGRRRDDADEERRRDGARRHRLDERRGEEPGEEDPAPRALERPDEVRADREDHGRADGDARDGERRRARVPPENLVGAGPAADCEARADERDRGGARDGDGRLQHDDRASRDHGGHDQKERPQREQVIGDRPGGREPLGRAVEERRERALDPRRRVRDDERGEQQQRRDADDHVARAAEPAPPARGGEDADAAGSDPARAQPREHAVEDVHR